MKRTSLERAATTIRSRVTVQTPLDPAVAQPDALRDAVFDALSSLSIDQRTAYREKLLGELRMAGLRVRPCLFMLGVSADQAEDLTSPEISALIRYVRLVEPKAMNAVVGTLRELLTEVRTAAQPACQLCAVSPEHRKTAQHAKSIGEFRESNQNEGVAVQ